MKNEKAVEIAASLFFVFSLFGCGENPFAGLFPPPANGEITTVFEEDGDEVGTSTVTVITVDVAVVPSVEVPVKETVLMVSVKELLVVKPVVPNSYVRVRLF